MKGYQPIWKKISIIALVLLFVFTISYGLKDRTVALPENPITDEIQDSSKVPLAGELKEFLNEKDSDSGQEDELNEEEEEKEQEEDEQKSQDEEKKRESNQQDIVDQKGQEKSSENSAASTDENNKYKDSDTYRDADENALNETSPNIDLNDEPNKDGKKNEYFTTTIKDGEVVTENEYEFRIIHKENDHTVKQTEVFLNGKVIDKFNGKVTLEEDENIIEIKVTYEDNKQEIFTVTKSYIVHLAEDDIVITTNLENDKIVDQPSFSFKAEASSGGKAAPLTITHNDEKLKSEDNHQYDVTLKEGENTFILLAEANGKKEKESYTVFYEKKEAKLTIETDVKDETVSDPDYAFYAIAKANDNPIDVMTKVNNERIESDGKGNYNVTLDEGENTVFFEAAHEGETVTAEYKVIYAKPDGGAEDEDVTQEIKLRISDLADGQTIKNSVHTFNVEAIDDAGNRLTGKGISISASNNGESIPINWSNDAHNSFTMNVQDGTNNITVTAKDKDGNIGTENMVIHGEVAGEGEPIGYVTLSLEAGTVGLGYIIPPTQVELYANERGSETIDRIFEKHGITYNYTGSHQNSFYLSKIYKSGLFVSGEPNIPEDLSAILEESGIPVRTDKFSPNELGEFHLTNMSGWMYSVNSTYPNVGFADYYFKDGDTIRIRFTLALGADIGGGIPEKNFGKEW